MKYIMDSMKIEMDQIIFLCQYSWVRQVILWYLNRKIIHEYFLSNCIIWNLTFCERIFVSFQILPSHHFQVVENNVVVVSLKIDPFFWCNSNNTGPSSLRSSNSAHEIVAAQKIGQQNSGQLCLLKISSKTLYTLILVHFRRREISFRHLSIDGVFA